MGTDPKSGLNAREDSLSADGQESKPRPRMREVKSRFMLPQKTPAHSATRNPTRVTPDIPKTKPPPALRGVPSRFNRTKKGPPPSSRQTDVGSSRHPLVALEPQPQPLHEQVHAGAAEKNAASAELTHSQSSDQNQFGSTARARRSNSAPISVAGESLVGSGPGKRVESDAAPCGLARVLRQHESPMPFGLPPPKANINVKSRPSNVTPTQRRAVFNRATPIGTLPKERDTHQTPVVSAEDAVRPEPALHSNGGTANATQTPSSFAEMEHPYSPAEGSGENASETDAAPLPAAKSAPAAGLTKDSLVRTHARVSSAPWKKSAAPTGVEHVRGPESRELSLLRARLLQLRYLNAALTKALQSQQDHHNSCILRVQMALVEKEDALAMQRGDLRQHEYLDRLAAILDAMECPLDKWRTSSSELESSAITLMQSVDCTRQCVPLPEGVTADPETIKDTLFAIAESGDAFGQMLDEFDSDVSRLARTTNDLVEVGRGEASTLVRMKDAVERLEKVNIQKWTYSTAAGAGLD